MLKKIAELLVIIGGINWGLYAFGFNLVNMVFGGIPMLEKTIYVLVALAALLLLPQLGSRD